MCKENIKPNDKNVIKKCVVPCLKAKKISQSTTLLAKLIKEHKMN